MKTANKIRTLVGCVAAGLALLAAWYAHSWFGPPPGTPPTTESNPPEPPTTTRVLPSVALRGSALANYDERLSFLADSVLAVLDGQSDDPLAVVVDLAQRAGLGQLDPATDYSRLPPEVVLAAIDLGAAQFGATAARALREQWETDLGGSRPAAETAHNLLLEARLPYGGGSAALEGMIGANEPSAILVGLHEFAVDSRLAGSVRSEALIRLREVVEPNAYPDHVREVVELAQEFGGDWLPRVQRLQTWMAAPAIDRAFLENALAPPAPGALEDLDLLVRHGGGSALDAETAAFLRSALADLDEAAWSGPDRLAWRRLLRELADAQSP
jgi:hypothetical protein